MRNTTVGPAVDALAWVAGVLSQHQLHRTLIDLGVEVSWDDTARIAAALDPLGTGYVPYAALAQRIDVNSGEWPHWLASQCVQRCVCSTTACTLTCGDMRVSRARVPSTNAPGNRAAVCRAGGASLGVGACPAQCRPQRLWPHPPAYREEGVALP
jgi:hypothetical protein